VDGEPARYRAFISYSHRDAAFGRRLHRRLEAYRLPRRLVGQATPHGPAPLRLSPIFRDREELPAAHDLSAQVRAALAVSQSLVVVCSPHARASPWVTQEVTLFRELHPDRPVLAALIEGEPADAFPEALAGASADGPRTEPLAADFRPGRDGPRLAVLKLVAGLAGVGLDELVQRDAQRRLRGVTAVTAVSLTLALGMGTLAAVALQARAEAERQRAEAEGLVEFMHTDLRRQLKRVGRLDVMAVANERALAYYADQDLARLPPGSLKQRAMILHAMGEDDMARGDATAAITKFREAHRSTAALLSGSANDPDRIFAHAQSEYWLAYVDYVGGAYARAELGFSRYKALAERLVKVAPNSAVSRQELGYAEGNLCSTALYQGKQDAVRRAEFGDKALRSCGSALGLVRAAAGPRPSPDARADLANRHGWLADAYALTGDFRMARLRRLEQERLIASLLAEDSNDAHFQDLWVASQRALARLDLQLGREGDARRRLAAASAKLRELIAADPRNQDRRTQSENVSTELAALGSPT